MKFCSLCRRAAPREATICSFDGCPLVEHDDVTPQSGETISRYRLLDVVAQGATGTVYRAEDQTSGRKLVLKLLTAELSQSPTVIHKIRRETKNTIKLANPHVAGVIECGDHDGRFFIVRDWLDGHPLSVTMREAGRMDLERVCGIVGQICTALTLIHRVGLVHRDLKPNHVFLVEGEGEPSVKLIDIGVAARVVGVESQRDVYGSLGYLSPEAAEGKLVNLRSDLYSLGCLIFEMLTGAPVFTGNNPTELVSQHISATPRRLSELAPEAPQALDQFVMKMLAKQATVRPFNASIVQREVERILAEHRAPPAPAGAGPGSAHEAREEDLGMVDTLYDNAFTVDAVKAAVAHADREYEPAPAPSGGQLIGADTMPDAPAVAMPQVDPQPASPQLSAPMVLAGAEPEASAPTPTPPPQVRAPAAAPAEMPASIKSAKATIMGLPVMDPEKVAAVRAASSARPATSAEKMPFVSMADFPYDELATQPELTAAPPVQSLQPTAQAGTTRPASYEVQYRQTPPAPTPAVDPHGTVSEPPDEGPVRRSSWWKVLLVIAGLFVLLSIAGGVALCTLSGCRAAPTSSGTPSDSATLGRPSTESR